MAYAPDTHPVVLTNNLVLALTRMRTEIDAMMHEMRLGGISGYGAIALLQSKLDEAAKHHAALTALVANAANNGTPEEERVLRNHITSVIPRAF